MAELEANVRVPVGSDLGAARSSARGRCTSPRTHQLGPPYAVAAWGRRPADVARTRASMRRVGSRRAACMGLSPAAREGQRAGLPPPGDKWEREREKERERWEAGVSSRDEG